MTEVKHGSRTTYNVHKCRCEKCRAANREYVRVWMRNEYHKVRKDKRQPHVHGTLRSYSFYGCRCSACKRVGLTYNREYMRKYRRRAAA